MDLSNDFFFGLLQDVHWLQTITKLPILVKGVLTAEDGKNSANNSNLSLDHFGKIYKYLNIFRAGNAARLSIQAGAAGIIVSNHGARQLDYVPATIMALEEVHINMIAPEAYIKLHL